MRKGISTLTRSTMTVTVLTFDATRFQAIRISICNRRVIAVEMVQTSDHTKMSHDELDTFAVEDTR